MASRIANLESGGEVSIVQRGRAASGPRRPKKKGIA